MFWVAFWAVLFTINTVFIFFTVRELLLHIRIRYFFDDDRFGDFGE